MEAKEITPQCIHCSITCKVSLLTTYVTFVYGFHFIVNRRPLWNNIPKFGTTCTFPWLILGDFNSALNFHDRSNGVDITPYKVRDLSNMCLNLGLMDVRSIGCFYTWTNNSIWSKIDMAMVNDAWIQSGFNSVANYLPSGCLSDHSPCVISLVGLEKSKRKPFRFFNMWTNHESFHEIVHNGWELDVWGRKQFLLCKKLLGLKGEFKKLNEKHFAHISSRAETVMSALKEEQLKLHDNPLNVELQSRVASMRKKAMDLCEVERSFYFQKAKCGYLNNSDKCTKFFHSMVKRNAKRNFIATIRKGDGTFTISLEVVADEFVLLFSSLLRENYPVQPINVDILTSGPRII